MTNYVGLYIFNHKFLNMAMSNSIIVDMHNAQCADFKNANISVNFGNVNKTPFIVTYERDYVQYHIAYSISHARCMIAQTDTSVHGNHLYRVITSICGDVVGIMGIPTLLNILINTMRKPFIFCTICGCELGNPTPSIGTCSKLICTQKFDLHVTDDCVKQAFEQDMYVFDFLVLTGVSALFAKKRDIVFSPFPLMYGHHDLAKLESIIPQQILHNRDMSSLYKLISDSSTDLSLCRKIGLNFYGFLKFVVRSNNTILRSSSLRICRSQKDGDSAIECDTETKTSQSLSPNYNFGDVILDVVHNPEIEENFRSELPTSSRYFPLDFHD